jgi:hypothetical protein
VEKKWSDSPQLALKGTSDDSDDISQLSDDIKDRWLGKWEVTVGDWSGAFNFTENGVATWEDLSSRQPHVGRWRDAGDSMQFTFADDVKTIGYQRTWVVQKPLQFAASGQILPARRGVFKMYKQ